MFVNLSYWAFNIELTKSNCIILLLYNCGWVDGESSVTIYCIHIKIHTMMQYIKLEYFPIEKSKTKYFSFSLKTFRFDLVLWIFITIYNTIYYYIPISKHVSSVYFRYTSGGMDTQAQVNYIQIYFLPISYYFFLYM